MPTIIGILLVVVTTIAYWQLPNSGFINYDDNIYVIENRNITSGLTTENIVWAFTTPSNANWHPLTWLSHMLDVELYGLAPSGHHITSLFLHLTNVLLLFTILHRTTGRFWQSSFVAALFALHPLNVESVAWISQRKSVLSTFFGLLTIGAYVHYIDKKKVASYLLVVLFFVLGLMSKPMLVTLPFILLLLDYWPLCRAQKQTPASLVWEKIPLFFIAMGSSIITFIAQKEGGAVSSLEVHSMQARLTNAMVAYLEYLEKILWPRELFVFYPHPGSALPVWKGWVAAVVLAAMTYAVIRSMRPYLAVGWLWYLGTLVPVIGIVQVGVQAMADRYMYIPMIGIFIAVGWGLPEFLKKIQHKNIILVTASGVLIPTLMALTWMQVSHWKNSITLFEHAVKTYDTKQKPPSFSLAYNHLGEAYHANKNYDQAMASYKSALKIKPEFAKAVFNMGVTLRQQGRIDEAIGQYRQALNLEPGFSQAHNNLAILLSIKKDFAGALSHFRQAITLDPNFAEAHNNLGSTLAGQGHFEEAMTYFKKAISINPHYIDAQKNLELAQSLAGQN